MFTDCVKLSVFSSLSVCVCVRVSQVGFRKGGVDALGRRTRLEVLLLVLLLVTLLALLACLLVLGLGFHSGTSRKSLVRRQ